MTMDAKHLREKATLCFRLADGLSLTNPSRFELMGNGEIAVLGITKSVKKKPPVSGIIYQGGSYGADDCDFKRMEAARMSAFGT